MSDEQSGLEATTTSEIEQVTAAPATSESVIPEKFGGDVSKLVESYNHLESKMGRMYALPTPDSSAERWSEFEQRVNGTGKFISRPDPTDADSMSKVYSQLGRPESAESYQVKIPDEIQPHVDPDMYNQYTQIAHEAGLNNDQAQKIMNFELQRLQEQSQANEAQRGVAEQQLRQSWGADYDNRMAGAKAAATVYGEKYPDAIQDLLNGPSGNNPAFIAMLSELGQSLQEEGHAGAVSMPQYGISADDAKDKIREVMDNRSHPYYDSSHPSHGEAVNSMKKLYGIAYPEG
jgi:hypothetical protein